MREAASLTVVRALTERGAVVHTYDPVAMAEARSRMKDWGGVEFAANAIDATDGADALVIVTEWKEFRSPDLDALRRNLKQPLIFDGRNLFDPAYISDAGFDYRCVGRALAAVAGQ
jgi:UDPglucose 6-dehydrogenase